MDDGHKCDGNDGQKVVSSNEKSSTGAGATTSNVGGTVAAATTSGFCITGPTGTSASTASRSVGQPAASRATSTPVGSSAAGTKGRSYRGRARNDSLVRQGSSATEGGQKNTTTSPAGPSASSSNTRPAGSTTGSEVQYVGPVADAKEAKGRPGSDREVAHVRQGSKSIEGGQKVSSATQSATVATGPSAPSGTRPGASVAGSSKAKNAASAADTNTEVTKGNFRPEDSNSRQGPEGQKDAPVSTTPTSESRLIGSTVGPSESQHTATKGESSKVDIEDNTVGPSAGSSGAANTTTDSAGRDTTTYQSEPKKGLSQSGKGGKDAHTRQGSGPSSTKVETSKASKDSTAAPADPSVDSSKAPASSTDNDKFATISGSRSRRGGKKGSHHRAKSGSASTEGELKNVARSSAAPVDSIPVGFIADEATKQPVTAGGSQPQTGKGKKSRHGRQKSASVSTGEAVKAVKAVKAVDNKDSKEPSTKRSSAPVALTVDQDKTTISSHPHKADAKSSQAHGISVFSSAGKSKVGKDNSAKSKEFVKSSSEQAASAARASGGQAKPAGSHLQSAMGEKSVRTRQASVSAFVEEWKESTAVCEEPPVKTSGAPVPLTTGSPKSQRAVASSHSQPEASEEDFHDCQVSVDSTEGSKETVGSKTATATSEESPIISPGVPVTSIPSPSEIQSAAVSPNSQPEAAMENSRVHQKAEHKPTERQPKKTESNNGGTTEMPASHSGTSVGSSAGQPEGKPAVAAGSDEVKDDTLQGKKGRNTQLSSESTSAGESKAPIRQNAAQQLITFCPAQIPENKPSQPISKGPKANADRRVSTTVNKKSDKRAVSRQHEQEGYTAPNGTFLNKNQLARLADGIKNSNGDTAYFQPSFIEDPWAGMKPVKIPCSRR